MKYLIIICTFACAIFISNAALAQTGCIRFRDHCLTQDDVKIKIEVRTQNDTLDGLESLPWLRSITIRGEDLGNDGVDLSVLSHIPNLEALHLVYLKRVDGFNTEDLRHLRSLSIVKTPFTSSMKLKYLPSLKRLELTHTGITDVSLISGINLEKLVLRGSELVNLSPLGNLPSLQLLSIAGSEIKSLDGLIFSENFQKLYASYSALSDISALTSATSMTHLYLEHSQITELSALCDLTELEVLKAHHTPLRDISQIGQHTKLKELWLFDTLIDNLSALSPLESVEELYISRIPATDLSPLAQMTGVRALWLDETKSLDLTPILSMTLLEFLQIEKKNVIGHENIKEYVANYRP